MLKVGNTKKLHILVDQRALLGEVLRWKKIRNEMDQDSSSQSQSISKDDPLGKAFGKEHPERVRGLGFGPFPSKVFNNTSSSSNDNQMKEYVANLEKELAATKAQLQVQNDMQKAMYPMKEANTNLHKGVENNIHPLVIMLMDNLLHDYYNIFQWRQLFGCCTSNVESSRLVEELQGINM
nr:uncharacterized protein LOC109155020 isoform X1 [Ipomoea batatas]